MGLRAHWLQHVPFEGLGSIESWLAGRRAEVSATRFYDRPSLPEPHDFDLLIVMGGPMSANEEARYPWLKDEKQLIARAIEAGKRVLGVCLGAQLIASALGARVRPNRHAEIGWFPVESVAADEPGNPAGVVPSGTEVFHWHGETFDLPSGARHAARSEACENQAFTLGDRVLALQFHLETTPAGARALVESCSGDLVPGPFLQPKRLLLGTSEQFARINRLMAGALDNLASA